MTQRKVGQDMVVRKKSSQQVVVLSRAISQSREASVIKKPNLAVHSSVPKKIRQEPVYRYDDSVNETFKEIFSPHHPVQKPPARGGVLWLLSGIALIVLIVTITSLFTKATITLALQESVIPVDMPITLYAEPSDGQIAFKTAKITDKQATLVTTTNKQSVATAASGTVKLFSTSAKPITIPSGSQLISSEKKVFTTKSKVVIPAGSVNKPGSVEVVVSAAVAGSDSNIKLDDLKLPAFPSVIARTTSEITGGISGDQFILSEPELIAAKAKLDSIIKASNPAAFLANQIPANFMLPESLLQVSDITYKTESKNDGVSVIAERTITGNMIDKETFHQFLINQLPESEREFMKVHSDSAISFSLTPSSNEIDNSTLQIQAKGSFIARAQFDETTGRTAIARVKKTAANTILRELPGVVSSDLQLFPPWASRLPGKISGIIFNVTYQSEK
jgi:hypothetical protein